MAPNSAGTRIRIIDAFTAEPFAGNPAAVVLLDTDEWPDESWMRQVAAEMNLSETAFAHPLAPGAEADWALRWFTPAVEVDLCGHATLATAHALYQDSGRAGTVRFSSRSGTLVAHTSDDGAITLDFPAATATETTVPAGLAKALGAVPKAVYRTGALGDLLIVLAGESVVRTLTPDISQLDELSHREDVRGILVTAAAEDSVHGYNYVSRMFAPAVGVPEDPVTGSAHTVLATYWSAQFGRDELTGLQASARSGLVHTAVVGQRVHLTGRAVTVVDGTLLHA